MTAGSRRWTVDMARRSKTHGSRGEGPRPLSTVNRHLVYVAALLVIATLAPIANACPVCFGDPNSPMAKGTSNGVMFLLGIVGFVQIGFVALFFSFWRRAKALKKFKEQFHVVR